MGQCKYCGSEVKEGMRFCGNCGAPQEAEVTAEASGEVAEETAAAAAEENAVTGTEESTAAGQEAPGEDRSPAPVVAVGEVAEETAATGTEESAAAGQEAPGETAKRKSRRLRTALFAAAAVTVRGTRHGL